MCFVYKNFVSTNDWIEFTFYIQENSSCWFKAKEILNLLGLKKSLKNYVAKDNKISWRELNTDPLRVNFLNPNTVFINLNGVYELVKKSKSLDSENFKEWIEDNLISL